MFHARTNPFGSFHATPGVPSVISNSPSGLNLRTTWPFSSAWPLSATHTLPSGESVILCGLTNNDCPNWLSTAPDWSNCRIGWSSESRHVVPPAQVSPHRTIAQIVPSGARLIPAVAPPTRLAVPANGQPGWGLGKRLRVPFAR